MDWSTESSYFSLLSRRRLLLLNWFMSWPTDGDRVLSRSRFLDALVLCPERVLRMRFAWLLLSLSLIAVPGCTRIDSPANPRGESTIEAVEKRWEIVQQASDLTQPGFEGRPVKSKDIHSDQARSGSFVSHAVAYIREYDWSDVPVDAEAGGPMKPVLELARVQEARLAEAGFMPLDSDFYSIGSDSKTRVNIHVSVRNQQRWGGGSGSGSGGYSVDANAQRIVYWRTYVVPDSGASLGVRLEYDRPRQRLLAEVSYNDRTVLDAPYPQGAATLIETIDLK